MSLGLESGVSPSPNSKPQSSLGFSQTQNQFGFREVVVARWERSSPLLSFSKKIFILCFMFFKMFFTFFIFVSVRLSRLAPGVLWSGCALGRVCSPRGTLGGAGPLRAWSTTRPEEKVKRAGFWAHSPETALPWTALPGPALPWFFYMF